MSPDDGTVHEGVRSTYAEIAETAGGGGTCCSPADLYTPEQLEAVPGGAALGLGTGTPVEEASPKPGETVVDLGSGAGVDVFLAADAVGPTGRAVGVDLTPEMVQRARRLAEEHGIENVEFLKAPIEEIPLPDGVADLVVSNCVINLVADKRRVLEEAFRLLAPGGRFVASDTVALEDQGDGAPDACGCTCSSGALTAHGWRALLAETGFTPIRIETEPPDGRFGPDVGTGLVRARKPRGRTTEGAENAKTQKMKEMEK